jgi:superfamily II DNA or RNA helicase
MPTKSQEQEEISERGRIQNEANERWLGSGLGTIVLAPGFGKTRVGIEISKKYNKVLIVVPTTNLRDQWRRELIKWGNTSEVRIECTKSAIKISEHYDLIIYDEIHMMLSEIYRKVLEIPAKHRLGLTGTPPLNNLKVLESLCPIIYKKTLQDALDAEAISEYTVQNIGVKFNAKDGYKYRLFDMKFKEAALALNKQKAVLGLADSVFDLARKYNKEDDKSLLTKFAKQYWSAMTMRKWMCYENESKLLEVLKILQAYPDKKWILFNKSIKFAEKLQKLIPQSLIYHSKLNNAKREEVLEKYSNTKKAVLIAVDALNAGLDVPDANAALEISYTSVPLTYQQRVGRVTRKEENKIALLINLYTIGTVEEKWLAKKNE